MCLSLLLASPLSSRPALAAPVSQLAAPVTQEDARATGAALQAAAQAGDVEVINGLFDWDALLGLALADLDETALAAPLAEFRRGFLNGIRDNGGLGGQIVTTVAQGGSYTLLRVHGEKSQPRLLFRVVSSSGGLNYHDLLLARDEAGEVRIVDVYLALAGERMSHTLRRAFLPLIPREDESLIKNQPAADRVFLEHFDDYRAFARHLVEQEGAKALAAYEKLPPELQQNKAVLIGRVIASQSVSDEQYLAAIDAFRRQFPKDAAVDLISIDAFVLKQQFEPALESVDRIEKIYGPDAFFNVLRAGIRYQAGDLEAAEKFAKKAIIEEPTLVDPYWHLTTISLDRKDYDETVRLLTVLQEQLHVELADLASIPIYAEFVKSPQYAKWAETRGR